ncbi:cAMP-dependent protein kinase catalytic subunit, partial [Kickxella alabastrina]
MSMLNQPDQAPQPLYSQPLPPPPQDFGGAQAQHALYTQPLPPVPGGMVVDSNGIVQMLGGTSAAATMAAIIGGCSSEPPSDGRTLDDFQLLHTLGTGTFGRVFLCQSKATKRFFAMKVLRKSQVVKLKQVEHINNEKNILEAARHPFIVRLECTMQNERNLYMLMEYVPGGELFSHLRRAGRFPDD